MAKKKGKKSKLKGTNPFKIKKIVLKRRKNKPSEPVPCLFMGKKYPSFTAAAKDTKRSRTYISKRATNL
jgi:hypothetical protein